MSPTFADRAAEEVRTLHVLLQAWFRGEGSDDPAPLAAHFDPRYVMVGAAGKVLTGEQFTKALPALRGSRPTLVMEVSDITLRLQQGDTVLLTYLERQHQDSGSTERWSGALLADRPGLSHPVWLYLHETFVG